MLFSFYKHHTRKIMNIKEAIEFINQKSWQGTKLGLERIQELNFLSGEPDKQLKFVHVAGTNGKGSTSKMIAEILMAAGYKVGMFNSPYLNCFNEYFSVNGNYIADNELIEMVEFLKPRIEKMKHRPTEFEIITEIGILYFEQKKCDIVLLEVGLGGRLDCTNFIQKPEVAVITSIGMDHIQELGNTIEEIAAEKAGIIKKGGNVVLYGQENSVEDVIKEKCKKESAQLQIVSFSTVNIHKSDLNGQIFEYKEFPEIKISLLGKHQVKNACTAIEVIQVMKDKGWKICDEEILSGLKNATWAGRFEVLKRKPLLIIDGGHNPQCFEVLAQNLLEYCNKKKVFLVVGIFKDKDYKKMAQSIAPALFKAITVTPDNPRALPAETLKECMEEYMSNVVCANSLMEGLDMALEEADSDSVICVAGSLSIMGAVRRKFI